MTARSAVPVSFKSSDAQLERAYEWAKDQALAYAFEGDPVGDWYEAALPGRQAFCMRDTAHQSAGAHFLGLDHQTLNMLRRFAENISDSKDWCSYWEIDRYNRPAPVDFKDDTQFWYNLPANFDIIDACYRMYLWSGDVSYINNSAFQNFYKRTVHDYVDRWDLSLERIMSRPRIMNIRGHADLENRFKRNRGIPSYDEGEQNFAVAIDELASQYAGYRAYARISELKGETAEAKEFLLRAESVKRFINDTWWDKKSDSYYSKLNLEHQLENRKFDPSLLYYEAADEGTKASGVLNAMVTAVEQGVPMNVELESHLPEILYRYGRPVPAYRVMLDLTRQDKNRREYPEVSFSVISAIATGLMGIAVEATEPSGTLQDSVYVDTTVVTNPRLTRETQWADIDHVRIRANEIRLRHDGLTQSAMENISGPSFMWKACFPGEFSHLFVDGKAATARRAEQHGKAISCTTIPMGSHVRRTVEASDFSKAKSAGL